MTGRVIIVTGASAGLGYETARYLCEGGNDVIFACRNEEKTKAAIEKIKRQNPNALATFMQVKSNGVVRSVTNCSDQLTCFMLCAPRCHLFH